MKRNFQPPAGYVKDTGLIVVLILLLLAYGRVGAFFLPLSIGVLVAVMVYPALFKPLAVLWHHLSAGLGYVVTRVVLGVVFLAVVTPMSLVRRALGYDPMLRKAWKRDSASVLTRRNHLYTGIDLSRPY